MPGVDLLGKVFGRWTVISRGRAADGRLEWLCRCDCGREKVVAGTSLRNGRSSSCGCYNSEISRETIKRVRKVTYEDLAGRTFGRLTVSHREKKPNGRWGWLCVCECGGENIVMADALTSGATISCGCITRVPKTLKTCSQCGSEYLGAPDQTCCSDPCRRKLQVLQGRLVPRGDWNCEGCGKSIPGAARNRRYCSKRCRDKVYKRGLNPEQQVIRVLKRGNDVE